MSVEKRVKEIVAEQLSKDANEVNLESSFIDDLGADYDPDEHVVIFSREGISKLLCSAGRGRHRMDHAGGKR